MTSRLPFALKIVRDPAEAGDLGTEPQPVTADADGQPVAALPLPKPTLAGEPMTFKQHTAAVGLFAFRSALARVRRAARRPGGVLHEIFDGKPPSFLEHLDYGTGRAWVPAGHERGLFDRLGVLHNRTVGALLVAIGDTISGLGHKPFRFYLTVLITGAAVLIISHFG